MCASGERLKKGSGRAEEGGEKRVDIQISINIQRMSCHPQIHPYSRKYINILTTTPSRASTFAFREPPPCATIPLGRGCHRPHYNHFPEYKCYQLIVFSTDPAAPPPAHSPGTERVLRSEGRRRDQESHLIILIIEEVFGWKMFGRLFPLFLFVFFLFLVGGGRNFVWCVFVCLPFLLEVLRQRMMKCLI